MKRRNKPELLIITSSFPRSPEDETCGYVRDFARRLSADFNVTVLAPPASSAIEWPEDEFALARSPSILPSRLSAFESSKDLNELLRRNIFVKLAAGLSILLFTLKALSLARKADVLCSHWLVPSGLAGAIASRLTGKPHVAIEHSGALHLLSRVRFGRSIARFIIEHSRRVVTVSSDLRERLIKLCPGAEAKAEVIPMGTLLLEESEPVFDRRSDSSSLTALFIGRLVEIKGVELLLQALEGMRNIELLVAGEGERRQALEEMAAARSIKARFFGRVDARERSALLAGSDFVVIPSLLLEGGRGEGTPVVCLESLATGLPVVASRTGGLAEVIDDGRNGLLFDPGDCGALASAIERLMDDASLRERLSANARAGAKAYSWKIIGDRFAGSIFAAMEKDD